MRVCDCWRSSGVEQLPCKQWVGGSNPPASASNIKGLRDLGAGGEIPKWPKGADCKSAGERLRRFKSSSPHHLLPSILIDIERVGRTGGNSSAVERQPSKLGVAGSNPVSRSTRSFVAAHWQWTRLGIQAHVAQSAELVLGKDEVSGSIPDMGSIFTDR